MFPLFDHSSLTLCRGCVTPKVLSNWKEASGMDPELIDGYEELPESAQEKVKRALEQCHVDDEDWNGVSVSVATSVYPPLIGFQDIEMNRYNPAKPAQGMFVKTPKKKTKVRHNHNLSKLLIADRL